MTCGCGGCRWGNRWWSASGAWRRAMLPNRRAVEILRRAARGAVVVRPTVVRGVPVTRFCYEAGEPILNERGYDLTLWSFCRMVRTGWLLPVEVGVYRA